MKIAVTYEDGQIFQHFGHTQQFKVYDIQDNKVVSSRIVDTMKKTPRYPSNLLPGGIGDLFSIILIEYVLLNCFFTHISDRSDIIA